MDLAEGEVKQRSDHSTCVQTVNAETCSPVVLGRVERIGAGRLRISSCSWARLRRNPAMHVSLVFNTRVQHEYDINFCLLFPELFLPSFTFKTLFCSLIFRWKLRLHSIEAFAKHWQCTNWHWQSEHHPSG